MRRLFCVVLILCLLVCVFSGCSGAYVSQESQVAVNKTVDYTDLLAGFNEENITDVGERENIFTEYVYAGNCIWALGSEWTDDGEETVLLLGGEISGQDTFRTVLQFPQQAIPEDVQRDVKAESLAADAAGNLFLIVRVVDYSADMIGGQISSYFLYDLAQDGTLTNCRRISCLDTALKIYSSSIIGNTLWVLASNGIGHFSIVDASGEWMQLRNGVSANWFQLLQAEECFVMGAFGDSYLMDSAGNLGEPVKLPSTFDRIQLPKPVRLQRPITSEGIVVWDGSGIWCWDTKKNETQPLLHWLDCGVDSTLLQEVFSIEEGRYLAVSRNENGNLLFSIITPASEEILAGRQIITLGVIGEIPELLKRQIIAFNNSNKQLFLQLIDYSTTDEYAGTIAMEADIIKNNAPDILLLNGGIAYNNYIRKGLFVDLYPFLDEDSELSRNQFVPNILHAEEVNGCLPVITVAYEIMTAIGPTDFVGTDPGWTIDEYNSVRERIPTLHAPIMRYSRQMALLHYLQVGGNQFIDYTAGRASLNTPDFAQLLEQSKAYPIAGTTEWLDPKTEIMSGKSLLYVHYFSHFETLRELAYIFEDGFTLKGFPGTSATGSAIIPRLRLGITTNCDDPEAAWVFLRQLLLPEFQDAICSREVIQKNSNAADFPLRCDSLEKAAKTAQQPLIGDVVLQIVTLDEMAKNDAYWREGISEELVGMLTSLIFSVETIYQYDATVATIIAEEAESYYIGNRNAKDAVELMQNRVQTYLAEQG